MWQTEALNAKPKAVIRATLDNDYVGNRIWRQCPRPFRTNRSSRPTGEQPWATIDVPTPGRSSLARYRWLAACLYGHCPPPGKPVDPELYSIPQYGFTVEHMNTNVSGSSLSWAPDACTLPTVERPLREAEFDTLFSSAVMGATRTSPSTVVLALTPQPAIAARAAELAARETSCCSFFTFTLTATGGGLSLAVTVPATHQPVLDALVERAQIHIRGEGQ